MGRSGTPDVLGLMIKATLRNPALRQAGTAFGRLVRHSAITPRGSTYKQTGHQRRTGVDLHRARGVLVQMGGQNVTIDPNFAAGCSF